MIKVNTNLSINSISSDHLWVKTCGFGKAPDAGCGMPGLQGRYSGAEHFWFFLGECKKERAIQKVKRNVSERITLTKHNRPFADGIKILIEIVHNYRIIKPILSVIKML